MSGKTAAKLQMLCHIQTLSELPDARVFDWVRDVTDDMGLYSAWECWCMLDEYLGLPAGTVLEGFYMHRMAQIVLEHRPVTQAGEEGTCP